MKNMKPLIKGWLLQGHSANMALFRLFVHEAKAIEKMSFTNFDMRSIPITNIIQFSITESDTKYKNGS